MKKSLLLASSLALALGVGAAVGARQVKVLEAKAETISAATTIYLDKGSLDWYSPYINFRVGSNPDSGWHFEEMNLVSGTLYSYEVLANTQVIQFNHTSTWHDNCYTDHLAPTSGDAGLYNKFTLSSQSDKIYGDWGYEQDTDPSASTRQFYVYDPNGVLGNTLANVNVFGFGAAGNIKSMGWPGVHTGVTTTTLSTRSVYSVALSTSYSKFIMNCGNGNNQTVDVEDVADHVGDILVIGAVKEGETKVFTTSWQKTNDFPAQDGYYIVGNNIGWKYSDGERMTSNNDFSPLDANGNIAKYTQLTVAANERIKLRSYINGVDTWINVTSDEYDFGERDNTETEDNGSFVFSKAGDYNIFAKNDVFYIAEYVELLDVTVTHVLFEGATAASTENGLNQDCVKGNAFTPAAPGEMGGYTFLGYFTDEDCETAFVNGTVVNAALHLYAKFMKHGYYMISEAGSWEVENGVLMDTESISPTNKAEISLTVTVANSKYNFTEYDGEKKNGQDGLGFDYSFAELTDGDYKNIKFKKTGTFQIYWSNSDNMIYINEGAAAFYSNFLNKVSEVCETVGTEGYIGRLQAEWAKQKIAFNSLSETEQSDIVAVGFNGGNDTDDLHKVVKKYNRIITKYGTEGVDGFEDFIWGQTNILPASGALPMHIMEAHNVTVFVIVVATVAAISVGLFFILKKKETK